MVNKMKILVKRFYQSDIDTVGLLYINNVFMCYTLEDAFQSSKIYGKTRIPAGEYPVRLRKVGTTHCYYNKRFPIMHKGTLHIQDIPNFENVLIHIGNTHKDTKGCLLVGTDFKHRSTYTKLRHSTVAYKKIYPLILSCLIHDEDVSIKIWG